ncbi:MAG: TIGR03936 family radical SAM-associated protein [Defluviitaleaceae bacterium]|nr:TIGR03936 family radical SAM-associated protein [Defluviitaleaceae bacterium]
MQTVDSKLNYHRYRIYFTKKDRARFVGHLDLQDLFAKALKRAKLPIAYSQGFNPHQLMSIALPLSMGMTGLGEIFEVFLTKATNPEQIVESLNPQMPLGILITSAKEVPNTGKAAAGRVIKAIYRITFPNLDKLDLNLLMSLPEMQMETKGKKGTKTVDIKADIFSIEREGNTITATISAGSGKNLKPQLLAEFINRQIDGGFAPHKISYERRLLILEENFNK